MFVNAYEGLHIFNPTCMNTASLVLLFCLLMLHHDLVSV